MHRSTCTSSEMIVTCAHDNDDTEEQTEEAQHDPEENKDPCSIGTPVCLPAVVWFEDKQGLLVVNVQWRGRTYVGTLCDSSKQNTISQNRLLLDEKNSSENCGNNLDEGEKKSRKYKINEKFLREITLEENIEFDTEGKREPKCHNTKIKLYQCSKCDKNYKFASGLHYHTKHNHKDDC